ncbi:MAG: TonB C-terminal domain-containing protein [Candidatus Aminicenantes bacterium]|nr:TonB C-terminal domain-containing protein [Candidatus Aminicenantes bacterium]
MRKLGYLLSLALHALLLLAILIVEFPVTIRPDPPRVVVVRIAEPLPPYVANDAPPHAGPGAGAPAPANGVPFAGTVSPAARAPGAGPPANRGTPSFAATGDLQLRAHAQGSFRLAPVGKSPEPWAIPFGPGPGARLSRGAYAPGAAARPGASGGVFLRPFDIRERAVADWTAAVLSRVERNWIVPASGRLFFSGRVQITLAIEKNGQRRSLVIDDSTLPAPLTLAALHAVQASLPLPPLPETIAGEAYSFTFVFVYNG